MPFPSPGIDETRTLPFEVGSARLVAAMGKDGKIHIANRDNPGSVGTGLLQRAVAVRPILTAPP